MGGKILDFSVFGSEMQIFKKAIDNIIFERWLNCYCDQPTRQAPEVLLPAAWQKESPPADQTGQ